MPRDTAFSAFVSSTRIVEDHLIASSTLERPTGLSILSGFSSTKRGSHLYYYVCGDIGHSPTMNASFAECGLYLEPHIFVKNCGLLAKEFEQSARHLRRG
jgi:hypothetical protein